MNTQLVKSLIQVINSLFVEERALLEEKLLVNPAPPATAELINLVQQGGSFDFLHAEPDLYTLEDGELC